MAEKKAIREPSLPFYFKRLDVFFENVRVSAAQQRDLEVARKALSEIFLMVYGDEDPFGCGGMRPQINPIY